MKQQQSADSTQHTAHSTQQTTDQRRSTNTKKKRLSLLSPVPCLLSHTGLTLVELLMAASIFAILLVGVGGHLRGSVIAWRRATSTIEHLQQTRIALDRLGQDLTHAFVFGAVDTWTPQPLFAADTLHCYTVRQGGDDSQTGPRARFVTYGLEDIEGVSSLIRRTRTVQDAASHVVGALERLVGPVAQLAIRYGYLPDEEEIGGEPSPQIEWRSEWTDATQLPKLVEVTLQLAASTAQRTPTAPRHLRRVFVIPTGSLTPSEESG